MGVAEAGAGNGAAVLGFILCLVVGVVVFVVVGEQVKGPAGHAFFYFRTLAIKDNNTLQKRKKE